MMIAGREGGVAFADVEPVAELLKSLANPHRLMIVCTLVEGERAVSELERDLDIRQPSLSQPLASLREAGLIVGRREAKAVFYRISDARAARVIEALHEIFCGPGASAAPARQDRSAAERRTGIGWGTWTPSQIRRPRGHLGAPSANSLFASA